MPLRRDDDELRRDATLITTFISHCRASRDDTLMMYRRRRHELSHYADYRRGRC